MRFMYENKISTATLGGHGTGAKLALATGCYNPERVTGNFNNLRCFQPRWWTFRS
jgi:hypothetical protein